MNVFRIAYEKISQNLGLEKVERVLLFGKGSNCNCDIDWQNIDESVRRIVQDIEQVNSDTVYVCYIASENIAEAGVLFSSIEEQNIMSGVSPRRQLPNRQNKNHWEREVFDVSPDKSFVKSQVCIDFFCTLFSQLIRLNKKINFLCAGSMNSLVCSLFEGVAFSGCYESSKITAKSLRTDCFEKDIIKQCFACEGRRFLFQNNVLYLKKAYKEKVAVNHEPAIKHRGVYVITGGNGGIGRMLSRWLVQKHEAHVIILGRRDLNETQAQQMKDNKVSAYIVADVSDYDELEKALFHVKEYYGHIDGVFHLAGKINDRLLRNYQKDDIPQIISPKIYGISNLFRISKNTDLGQVCCFSSLSGVIGNVGQAIYSAANAFMDDFCACVQKNEQYKNWISIDWGAWNSEGMQMNIESSDVLPMNPEECFQVLEYLLTQPRTQFAVWNGTEDLLEVKSSAEVQTHKASDLSYETFIQNWIHEQVKKFSGFSSIEFDQSIIDLGVDSVGLINIAVSLENEIKKHVPGYRLNKSLLFEYYSINKITSFLMQSLPAEAIEKIVTSIFGSVEKKTISEPPGIDEPFSTPDSAPIETDDSDIAIIGIAGEFPNAKNIDELKKLLANGECAIKPIPKNRWNWKEYYSQDKNDKGRSYCRHGGFIEDAKKFDNAFFGITPSEAVKIDPQERRFLQVSYHALEDSGYFANPNKKTGVFVAAMFGHYQNLDDESQPFVNDSFSSIANRVSFFMDFNGPSLCVDSMCSGSLTALNLAIDSIKNGECYQAIVGGANIMPHPGKYIALSRAGFLSPSGRCQSFGIDADGYVPGEGVISIVIKKLKDALSDGNKIYGIIKGIGVNSAGRTSGYSVPSVSSQVDVIKTALKQAAVAPEKITYIETHGTGTALGDPIEIDALKSTYGEAKKQTHWIGSVKSNLGHLESAAGLAGLVKVLLQFENNQIYPSIFSQIENSEIFLKDSSFKIAKNNIPWNGVRYAGVSAFGAGGSNAHVILQNYVNQSPGENLKEYIIPISAKTKEALQQRIDDLLLFVQESDYDLYSLSYTLCCAREHFDKRICYVVQNKEELITALKKNNFVTKHELVEKYLAHKPVDFQSIFSVKSLQKLPFYPFNGNEYWLNFDKKKSTKSDVVFTLLTPSYMRPEKIDIEDDIAVIYVNPKEIITEENWMSILSNLPKSKKLRIVLNCVLPTQCSPSAIYETDDLAVSSCTVPLNQQVQQYLRYSAPLGAASSCTQNFAPLGERDVPSDNFAPLGNSSGNVGFSLEPEGTNSRGDTLAGTAVPPDNISLSSESKGDSSLNETLRYGTVFSLGKALVEARRPVEVMIAYQDNSESDESKVLYSIHGLFRGLSLEDQNIKTIFVEKDEADLKIIGHLHSNIQNGQSFTRVKLTGNNLHRYTLEKTELSETFSRIKNGGVYLITGGMGSIGLFVAKFLRKKYDAKVILAGRSKISTDKIKKNFGSLYDESKIMYVSADISDFAETQSLILQALERFHEINGIVHSAGQIHDALFSIKKESEFLSTISVKADGAENLDLCTKDLRLDFFACFSSLVTITGNVGQTDYMAGNDYLDVFCKVRNEQVKQGQRFGHTISINWPLWANHETSHADLKNYMKDTLGIDILEEDLGVKLFDYIVNHTPENLDQIVPLPGNVSLEKFLEYSGYLPQVDENRELAVERKNAVANPEEIMEIVSQIANTDVAIDFEIAFGELGLNSIMLQELAQKIGEKYSLSIPVIVLFKYNSIRKLSQYVNEKLPQNDEQPRKKIFNNTPSDATTDKRIAIIGMSGRMPQANDLNEYWENLINQKCVITNIDRWKDRKYRGGVINGYDLFDHRFFNISMREAKLMDPQQRIFIECCYNTIADAGYRPADLTNVGVFAGAQFNDYRNLIVKSGMSHHPFMAIGNSNNMISNRVSYFFNFSGPSQTIDTACSSAAVAIHRAVESLRIKECDYCLAGAVNLMLDPETTDSAKSMGVLSPNFRCATFDESADGYVRSEGVGCVLLKRYSDAVRDGDSIYGIIESICEKHGGHATSITAPNQDAQTELIVSTYTSDLAKKVSYIETHGTGTKLGDPIEIDALKTAWKKLLANDNNHTVYLGAVKSAVGHLEPASGMASLFKILLVMKHKWLPANQNFTHQNPLIDLQNTNFCILTKNVSLEDENTPLVVGMSCFGFGGSNTHMVLSEYIESTSDGDESNEPLLFTISAKSEDSLKAIIENLIRFCDSDDFRKLSLADISFTLNVGREHFGHRTAFIASTKDEFRLNLRNLTNDDFKKIQRLNVMGNQVKSKEIDLCRQKYLSGYEIDWSALYERGRKRVHLPGYVFEKKRCWFEENADE